MDAELVLDRHAPHVVGCSRFSVGANQPLRHDEERNAFNALWRIGFARQHEMNDIFGEVVFPVGDKDLLAVEPIAAIGLRDGPRADRGQVGTRLWLR